ncbi:hypothetical protein [Cetobacterium sp.]|uniref:hypothetical protein n=1 Tax=Cetobacterium sp. TaxID=2071632 RepID=UPI003F3D50FF
MYKKNFLMSLIGVVLFSSVAFSEVFIKIHEPIRFKDLNTRSLERDYIVGEGSFEVYTDNEKVDLGKKIVFRFPETGYMSNKKNNIKIEKYSMETSDNSMLISTKREIVKFYALVNRREIAKNKEPKVIEGEYTGYIPVVFSLYQNIRKGENNQ